MTKRISDIDLVIAGLGPVGAVAANLAGAAGLRTVVIERGTDPYHMPRAIVFDAEIMRIFDSIGLSAAIAKVTKPLGGSVYIGADRKPIRVFRAHPRPHERAWYPSNLFYQPQLEAILREGIGRFPNVTVLLGHDAVATEQGGGRVTVKAMTADDDTPVEIDTAFLLACDGASSAIRKALDVPLDDIGFEERWLVVDTLVDGPMRWPADYEIPTEVKEDRFSLMVCDPARPATLIPGSGRHRRWEYMLLAGETDEEVVTEGWLRRQIGSWISPDDIEIVRAAVYRFRALVAKRWRVGNVFLVGDAAHQTPPFFGQGMCHGIRDAAQLMWKLALVRGGQAQGALLDSYQPEREPHVREIIAASVAAGAEVCKLDPAEAVARDAAFRAAEAARDRSVAMTDVVPPIRAGVIDPQTGGMRLPEFVFMEGGAMRHVDEVLGGRFTLLARAALPFDPGLRDRLGGQTLTVDAEGSPLTDQDGRFGMWMAERRALWVLVRPDRHVYGTAADPAGLRALLDRLFAGLHLTQPATAPMTEGSLP